MKKLLVHFFLPRRFRDLVTFAFLWYISLTVTLFCTFAIALGFFGWDWDFILDYWYLNLLFWGGWTVMIIGYGNNLVRKKKEE